MRNKYPDDIYGTEVPPEKRIKSLERTYIFRLEPVAKPRQTQSDRWNLRPAVMRYRNFADELRKQAEEQNFIMPVSEYLLIFNISMPESWSDKERERMIYKPHQTKPDIDNLQKAFFDALLEEDCHIYDGRVQKYWSDNGFIVLVTGGAKCQRCGI